MPLNQPQKSAFSRERSRSSVRPISGQVIGTRVDGGTTIVLQNTARFANYPQKDVMIDIVTPGFAQRSASGDFVYNPMDQLRSTYTGGDSGFKASITTGSIKETWEEVANVGYFYFGIPSADPNTIDIDNLKTYVSTKTLANIKSSDFMGYVAAAEAQKTLRMLANPLGSVKSLLDWISQLRKARRNLRIDRGLAGGSRRVNGRTFYRIARPTSGPGKEIREPRDSIVIPIGEAISGTVLANNLGLRPLMMDIDAILHQIPQAHKLARQTFRATESVEAASTRTQTYYSGAYRFTANIETKHKVTVRGSVAVEDRFDVLADFGLGLASLPESAWEIVPYSFIVDYFINVGDLLSALRAIATQNIVGSTLVTTIETTVVRTWTGTSITNPSWVVERAISGSDQYALYSKQRRIGLESPGLALSPANVALRPAAVQNMVSLICQKLLHIRAGSKTSTPFF